MFTRFKLLQNQTKQNSIQRNDLVKSNSRDHTLNLDELNLDQFEYEEEILNYVRNIILNDKNLFHLGRNKLFDEIISKSKNKERKYELEKILIDNKFNHEIYPNDYAYCLISNHVYCYNFDSKKSTSNGVISGYSSKYNESNEIKLSQSQIIEDDEIHCDCVWKELNSSGWIIHSLYKINDFKSVIYINENKKQIVAAYQGLKFKFKDLFNKKTSYINSLTKLTNKHLNLMIENVKTCVGLSNQLNYSLSFTGYSFGAIFAQLSLFICHKYLNKTQSKAVVFESIGLFELLDKLNQSNPNNINLNELDIRTYLIQPSFFNTVNTHIGVKANIYDKDGFEQFTQTNEIILKHLRKKYKIYKKFPNKKCNPHQYYMCGLNTLLSTNIKFLLTKFKSPNKKFRIISEWPTNNEISIISNNNDSNSTKKSLSSDLIIESIKKFFEITRKTKKIDLLKTKEEIVELNFVSDESRTIRFKKIEVPFEKDYSDNVKYIDIYDKKNLNLNNQTDVYLDKINQLNSTLDSTEETSSLHEEIYNLKNKYDVIDDVSENSKVITTKDEIPVHKIYDSFSHQCDLNPNLKEKIDFLLNNGSDIDEIVIREVLNIQDYSSPNDPDPVCYSISSLVKIRFEDV